jgi:hypothetical protein
VGRLGVLGQPDDAGGKVEDQRLDLAGGPGSAELGDGDAQLVRARAGHGQTPGVLGMSLPVEGEEALALLH